MYKKLFLPAPANLNFAFKANVFLIVFFTSYLCSRYELDTPFFLHSSFAHLKPGDLIANNNLFVWSYFYSVNIISLLYLLDIFFFQLFIFLVYKYICKVFITFLWAGWWINFEARVRISLLCLKPFYEKLFWSRSLK